MGGEGRGGEGRGGECLVMQICLNYLISFNSFGRQKKVTTAHRYAILDSAHRTLISPKVFAGRSCVVNLTK